MMANLRSAALVLLCSMAWVCQAQVESPAEALDQEGELVEEFTPRPPAPRYSRAALAGIEPPDVPGFDPSIPNGGVVEPKAVCDPVPPSMRVAGSIEVEPSTSYMIAVSRKHLTRLLTPFASPDALTNSQRHQLMREGQSLLLSLPPDTCEPIGVFLFDRNGDPDHAINLTLFPQDIPQVDLRLTWSSQHRELLARQPATATGINEPPPWDARTPHVEALTTLMRLLALGQIPPGFSMHALRGQGASDPVCVLPGLSVIPRQRLDGARLQIFVAEAKNTSRAEIDIDETGCGAVGVLAAAAWPTSRLQPGERTELYLIREPGRPGSVRSRPSVLD